MSLDLIDELLDLALKDSYIIFSCSIMNAEVVKFLKINFKIKNKLGME